MSYTVAFLREFVKQFRRLPRDVRLRVRRRVTELSENPYLGLKLVGELQDIGRTGLENTGSSTKLTKTEN